MLTCIDDHIQLKITDFGLAKETRTNMASTHCGFVYPFYSFIGY